MLSPGGRSCPRRTHMRARCHPGAMERSIGQKETRELAVMVDTFKPLKLTKAAMNLDDGKYYKSWIE